jgi:uncharacterized membrane protein
MNKSFLIFLTFLVYALFPAISYASGGTFVETGHRGLEQKIADILVWIVLIVVPVVVIILYWKIHILPEKYAEKIHHPNTRAIQVICVLSIIFGGILWPLAWVIAYSKPVFYKLAYGTDKSDEFFLDPNGQHANKPINLSIVDDEISSLEEKLEGLTKRREAILSQHPSISKAY